MGQESGGSAGAGAARGIGCLIDRNVATVVVSGAPLAGDKSAFGVLCCCCCCCIGKTVFHRHKAHTIASAAAADNDAPSWLVLVVLFDAIGFERSVAAANSSTSQASGTTFGQLRALALQTASG